MFKDRKKASRDKSVEDKEIEKWNKTGKIEVSVLCRNDALRWNTTIDGDVISWLKDSTGREREFEA